MFSVVNAVGIQAAGDQLSYEMCGGITEPVKLTRVGRWAWPQQHGPRSLPPERYATRRSSWYRPASIARGSDSRRSCGPTVLLEISGISQLRQHQPSRCDCTGDDSRRNEPPPLVSIVKQPLREISDDRIAQRNSWRADLSPKLLTVRGWSMAQPAEVITHGDLMTIPSALSWRQ